MADHPQHFCGYTAATLRAVSQPSVFDAVVAVVRVMRPSFDFDDRVLRQSRISG
jgi:hypothetical protein